MDDPIPFDPSRCDAEPLPTIFGRRLVPHCAVPVVPPPIREAGARLLALAPMSAAGAPGPPGPTGRRGFTACIWQGKVVGGAGNLWQVLLFPRGPDCAPDRPAVWVTVLGIPASSSDDAPIGKWIGPIHGHDERALVCGSSMGSAGSAGSDGGDVPGHSYGDDGCHATAYYWNLPLGGKLAFTPSGGIPHMVGTVPGVAVCVIYDFDGGNVRAARNARVFNIHPTAICGLGGRLIQVKMIDGCFFADMEPC